MNLFTQQVVTIGKITPQQVTLLGTGFFVTPNKVATSRHVIGNQSEGLVILAPHIVDINEYQDTANNECHPISAKVAEIDPLKDLAILEVDAELRAQIPELTGFDDVRVSEEVGIFGFPHCVEGRRVLTFQKAEIGAKILLESSGGVKSKHAVINTQSRPGQSGSLVFSPRLQKIVGLLVGAYVPGGPMASLMGVNPKELHQTTHCISAEYLREML